MSQRSVNSEVCSFVIEWRKNSHTFERICHTIPQKIYPKEIVGFKLVDDCKGYKIDLCNISNFSPLDGKDCRFMQTIPTPSTEQQTAVFEARHISKIYKMGNVEVHALRDLSLDLYQNELVVLLGPSGSGKSTLLNILGGLDVPTSGTVHFRDHDLTAYDDDALTHYRRQHVGFVFQFYNLIPGLTARENVALITDIADNPMNPEEALKLVGLENRMDHYPSQMSGGEQQRVAIARAIAKRPDVLLCDEPTGALDVKTGVIVLEAIQSINRELGTTTAVITHNAVIASIASRVIMLSDGRVQSIQENKSKSDARDLIW
jgi:putative ABC transport system ATP-binding protein